MLNPNSGYRITTQRGSFYDLSPEVGDTRKRYITPSDFFFRSLTAGLLYAIQQCEVGLPLIAQADTGRSDRIEAEGFPPGRLTLVYDGIVETSTPVVRIDAV